jgi:hypothetical protein
LLSEIYCLLFLSCPPSSTFSLMFASPLLRTSSSTSADDCITSASLSILFKLQIPWTPSEYDACASGGNRPAGVGSERVH